MGDSSLRVPLVFLVLLLSAGLSVVVGSPDAGGVNADQGRYVAAQRSGDDWPW
jgi:hypothetical protein